MILFIVKDSAKAIFTRLLDGIKPEHIDTITKSATQVEGVHHVNDVKARWFGHEITADISVTLDSHLTIKEGHDVVKNVIHRLQHDVEHLSAVQVHVDPLEEQGSSFHAHEHFHQNQGSYSHEHGKVYKNNPRNDHKNDHKHGHHHGHHHHASH